MNKMYFLILILFCFGCKNKNSQGQYEETDTAIICNDKEKTCKIKNNSNLYKVVSLDYDRKKWLQRIFVETKTDVISNSDVLIDIIFELDSIYNFDEGTSISFFSNAEDAKYLDELLEEMDSTKMEKLIRNWKNEVYIGEFYCDSNKLILYPFSKTHEQTKIQIVTGNAGNASKKLVE